MSKECTCDKPGSFKSELLMCLDFANKIEEELTKEFPDKIYFKADSERLGHVLTNIAVLIQDNKLKLLEEHKEIIGDFDSKEIQIRELGPNKHYWLVDKDGEASLVYYYYNDHCNCFGFGFNIADGGGFLPLTDLIDTSKILSVYLSPHTV